MPYLKFSRDKRGYENFFLIEPPSGGRDQRGRARPRLLFWFRTPPHVKVGRVPFSDDVRKMVEAQNPDLTFDWARIMSTPIPPPDLDQWRERRRAEKAARRAARDEERQEEAVEAETAVDEAEAEPISTAQETTSAFEDAEAVVEAIETRGEAVEPVDDGPAETAAATSDSQQVAGAHEHRRRRRRRRRGRGHHHPSVQPVSEPAAEPASTQQDAAPTDKAPPSDEV